METQTAARPDQPQVGEVRANHRLNEANLAAWLKANVDPFDGPLEVQQFTRGASNPNFLLTRVGTATAFQRIDRTVRVRVERFR